MPSGGRRRGRRDNGLEAAEYAVVGDVDPRIGEHLLDVLGVGGIAAYLQPSADLHPITRTTTLPNRPTDRLYADREHLATAREYLAQLTAEPDPAAADADRDPDSRGDTTDRGPSSQGDAGRGAARGGAGQDGAVHDGAGPGDRTGGQGGDPAAADKDQIDAVFASIVAAFHGDEKPGFPRWPAAEDIAEPGATPRRRRTDPPPEVRWARGDDPAAGYEPSLLDGLDRFGAELPEDEEEGFTPPPPPPLPRLSRAAVAALAAIVGGLALFLWPGLLPVEPELTVLIGFSGVLGGFVTLVWRLRPDGDDDSDPDDGARV